MPSYIPRLVGFVLLATTLVVVGLRSLFLAAEMFLVLVLAGLFGIFLYRITHLLIRFTHLSYKPALAVIVTTLLTAGVLTLTLFGVQIGSQIESMRERVDEGINRLQAFTEEYPIAKSILGSNHILESVVSEESATKSDSQPQTSAKPRQERQDANESRANEEKQSSTGAGQEPQSDASDTESGSAESSSAKSDSKEMTDSAMQAATTVGWLFRSTLGVLVNMVIIFFVGLYLALEPEIYEAGLVRLFPPEKRERISGVIHEVCDTLWHWLIGRFASMTITGIGAGLLLLALQVPMAFSIGMLTALLTFIPNIGPLIAVCFAMIVAAPEGLATVGWVLLGFMALELIESYLITPRIDQRQVSLPPALVIAAQAFMGVVLGFLGTAVASPLLAAAKVITSELYVKDWLEAGATTPRKEDKLPEQTPKP